MQIHSNKKETSLTSVLAVYYKHMVSNTTYSAIVLCIERAQIYDYFRCFTEMDLMMDSSAMSSFILQWNLESVFPRSRVTLPVLRI